MQQAVVVEEQGQRRLAEYVLAARGARRWSQVELAERAGVSSSLISNIEKGYKKRVTVATLRKLAAALAVDLREVLAAAGYTPVLAGEVPAIAEGEAGVSQKWQMAAGIMLDQFRAADLPAEQEDALLQDLLDAWEILLRARARETRAPRRDGRRGPGADRSAPPPDQYRAQDGA